MSPLSTVLYPPSAKNYLSPFSAHLVPLCPPLCPEDELIAPQLRNMHWCAVTSLSQVSDASFSILCSCGSVSSSSFVHFVLCPCVASRWIDCSSSLVYLPPPSALYPGTNYIIIPSTPWYKMYLSSSSSSKVYPLTEPPSVGTLVTLYQQQDIDQIYIFVQSGAKMNEQKLLFGNIPMNITGCTTHCNQQT